MMRHTRKCLFILVLMALSLALTIPVLAQVHWRYLRAPAPRRLRQARSGAAP